MCAGRIRLSEPHENKIGSQSVHVVMEAVWRLSGSCQDQSLPCPGRPSHVDHDRGIVPGFFFLVQPIHAHLNLLAIF